MPNRIKLKVKEIIPRIYNVKSVRLETGEDVEYKAGQFLSVWLKSDKEYKRYLSISSSPTEKGYIEFTKKITESGFSLALEKLKVAESLIVEYPFGNFTLADPKTKIAFLSGGIGITPIRSICKYAVDKKLETDIVLLYANRTSKDIAFKDDFDLMQKEYPKLKVVYVLSEPSLDFSSLSGRINAQMIKEEVPDYGQRKFYLCGPPAMVEVMQKIVTEELALPKTNIITENFQGY